MKPKSLGDYKARTSYQLEGENYPSNIMDFHNYLKDFAHELAKLGYFLLIPNVTNDFVGPPLIFDFSKFISNKKFLIENLVLQETEYQSYSHLKENLQMPDLLIHVLNINHEKLDINLNRLRISIEDSLFGITARIKYFRFKHILPLSSFLQFNFSLQENLKDILLKTYFFTDSDHLRKDSIKLKYILSDNPKWKLVDKNITREKYLNILAEALIGIIKGFS